MMSMTTHRSLTVQPMKHKSPRRMTGVFPNEFCRLKKAQNKISSFFPFIFIASILLYLTIFIICIYCFHFVHLLFFCSFFSVQYELTIVASDNLNEQETKVVIFVRDVNDLPPEFGERMYQAFIFEESIHKVKPILQVRIVFFKFFFFSSLHPHFLYIYHESFKSDV